MKKRIFLIAGAILLLTGCSPKTYEQNMVYGKGINSGYMFDNIDRDRELIHKIERGNADFFSQKLRYGENKIAEILTAKKNFQAKGGALEEQELPAKQGLKNNVFGDIARDFKYAK
ncbi:lipoprotein [Campylobacter concisus]|jgi:lipoprotein|uniref:Type IV secretion system putative lipoprotein virB7 n=1 Tax=Campylobacter concisus TaxID=199 RepID=A0A2R4P332_9BACT|nr:lipoprotein [Campylobacter concisus]AVX45083.1 hypothetical protein CCS77_2077 [Campylobacter concisus]